MTQTKSSDIFIIQKVEKFSSSDYSDSNLLKSEEIEFNSRVSAFSKVNFSKFNKFEVLKVWGSMRYYFLFSWRCVFYNFFNPDVRKPRIRLDLILRCLLCRKCKFKTFCGPDLQNFECSRFCQFKVLTLILLPCHYFIIQLTTE